MKVKINLHIIKNGTLNKKSGVREFTVDREFVYELYLNYIKYTIEITQGFKTDFGSIPQILWFFFDPDKWLSYILHDLLYQYNGFFDNEGNFIPVTKRQADLILYYGMKDEGAGFIERELVLLGLDIGGHLAWYKNTCLNGLDHK